MIGRGFWVVAALAVAVAVANAPALACSIVAPRPICDGGAACTPAVIAQMERERAQRFAIDHGRDMARAVDRRQASAALDRGNDLARILMPNMVLPVALNEDSCDRWTADDEDGPGRHLSFAEATTIIRREHGLADTARVDPGLLATFAERRAACNAAARRDFASYLTTALPPKQVRELWDFLVPRAGVAVPADGAEPLNGPRLLTMADGGDLNFNEVDALPHIDARRERAGEYLRNHRNGRAVMATLNVFIATRGAAAALPDCD